MSFAARVYSLHRATRCMTVLCLLVFLAACSKEELYGQLTERQANEIVAVLRHAGVAVDKSRSGDGSSYTVSVHARDFANAVSLLHEWGLPDRNFASMGDVFKKEGFVSSPLEERARLKHALSQELSRTLSMLDGVVEARVHVVIPENNPLDHSPNEAKAGIFIKHRRGFDIDGKKNQIVGFVMRSVDGLKNPENVSIEWSEARPLPSFIVPPLSFWEQYRMLVWAVGSLLLALLGAVLWVRQGSGSKDKKSSSHRRIRNVGAS